MRYDFADPLHWMVYGKPGATVALTRQTVGVTLLGHAESTTDGTSFSLGALTYVTGRKYILFACGAAGIAPGSATCSGSGLTWTELESPFVGSGLNRRLFAFESSGTSSGGAQVVAVATAGEPWTSCCLAVVEITNFDSGTPIIQSETIGAGLANNTGTELALAPLEHATNVYLAAVALSINGSVTHDADFAELSDFAIGSGVQTLQVAWAAGQATYTPTHGSAGCAVIGLEIKSALA